MYLSRANSIGWVNVKKKQVGNIYLNTKCTYNAQFYLMTKCKKQNTLFYAVDQCITLHLYLFDE